MELDHLERCSLAELEALYATGGSVDVPTGHYRGLHLRRIDAPGARRPGYALSAAFGLLPFGIDFDRCCWTFGHPSVRAGLFVAEPGRSRWRETETVRLRYTPSRLPFFVRRVLYDEVKPLTSSLALGMGGLWADAGRGDHFFFALLRQP